LVGYPRTKQGDPLDYVFMTSNTALSCLSLGWHDRYMWIHRHQQRSKWFFGVETFAQVLLRKVGVHRPDVFIIARTGLTTVGLSGGIQIT